MDIKETDLPGIGRKFQADTRAGERIVIIVHDDGNREIYQFDRGNYDESSASVSLDFCPRSLAYPRVGQDL